MSDLNLKLHDWLMIGSGAAMFVFGLLLDWTTIDTAFGSASSDDPFDYFFTGGIAWLLVVGVGVLVPFERAARLPPAAPWSVVYVTAAGAATALMVLRVLLGARWDFADRGVGMWGALVWAGLSFAGATKNYRDLGGTWDELTDVGALKQRFGRSRPDDGPPPPSTES